MLGVDSSEYSGFFTALLLDCLEGGWNFVKKIAFGTFLTVITLFLVIVPAIAAAFHQSEAVWWAYRTMSKPLLKVVGL